MANEMTAEQAQELIVRKQNETLTACKEAIEKALDEYGCQQVVVFAKMVIPGVGMILLNPKAVQWGMKIIFKEKTNRRG